MVLQDGIRRIRRGRGFEYRAADGQRIADEVELSRIRSLAVPPMWRDVRICADPDAPLQAIGIDAAGRTQYRYHEQWQQQAQEQKFERVLELATALPALRRWVTQQLRLDGQSRPTALAAGIRMLDSAHLRVGSEQYAAQHGSIGLTTLRCCHVQIDGDRLTLRFRGKSAVPWESQLRDRDLVGVLQRLLRGPRSRLLWWQDGRARRLVRATDLNEALRERTGGAFTAKDFRTLHGTALAARTLARIGTADTETAMRHAISEAVTATARALGNTPAVARSSYIDPRVLEAYRQGRVIDPAARVPEAQLAALFEG